MAREDAQMKIRLPEALKEEIEVAAQSGGRSMNAEIVSRLESAGKLPDIAKLQTMVANTAFDLAAQRTQDTGHALHLFEVAVALKMAIAHQLYNHLRPPSREDLLEWDTSADKAIKAAQDAIKDRGDALEEFNATYESMRAVLASLQPVNLLVSTPLKGWTRDQGDMPEIPQDPDDLLRLAKQREREADTLRDVHRSYKAREAARAAIDEIEKIENDERDNKNRD